MTVEEIMALARRVRALIPDEEAARRVGPLLEIERQHAMSDRIEETCREAGLSVLGSVVIAETIAGLLGGWGSRYGNLDPLTMEATDVLVAQLEGASVFGDGLYLLPEETALQADHIAILIDWWDSREADGPQEDDLGIEG